MAIAPLRPFYIIVTCLDTKKVLQNITMRYRTDALARDRFRKYFVPKLRDTLYRVTVDLRRGHPSLGKVIESVAIIKQCE